MMNRELRTLKDVVQYLTAISDTVESVRRRASRYDKESFLRAQENLVSAIDHFKVGINNIKSSLDAATKAEEKQALIEELELKAKQGDNNGQRKDGTR